jgi:hypothetical protein
MSLFQTKLKWVGKPILEQGRKKFYEAIMVNDEKVGTFFYNDFFLLNRSDLEYS